MLPEQWETFRQAARLEDYAHPSAIRRGEGLMRRLDVSADPVAMLDAASQEAAKAARVVLTVEGGAIFVTY